jgi:hypothetical protein
VACIHWVKLLGFEMEFASGCPVETPQQFNHKEEPGICSKLDSSGIYAFERPFGGHDKIDGLRHDVQDRGFAIQLIGRKFEDLVAIPGFLLNRLIPKEFAVISFVPNMALALERLAYLSRAYTGKPIGDGPN